MKISHLGATERFDAQIIDFGALVVDVAGFAVRVNGRDVPTTLTEFLLLRALAATPFYTLDRSALAAAVRVRGIGSENAELMAPRTVDLHISRLRRKLVQAGYDCIRTMRFVGYRFVPN